MGKQKMNHHLIESILGLLYSLRDYGITIEQLMDYGTQLPDSDGLDMQSFQTAYEIIRFMDEMPGGFLIYRADGDEEIIYANRALLRIFQCDTLREFFELTGYSFRGMVYPEDLETVEQSIWEQIADSQYDLDYVEYRITRKDGAIRWIEDYGHYVHTEGSGDIFYVFLSDGTEKRERQMEERAKLLWDKKQKEQKIRQLTEEYDKERKLINQEYLRRLEVIQGLSMEYETILYADLDADQVLPYRFSSRTESQFDKKFQHCSYAGFVSDYIQTWVYPEDRELLARNITPPYIREHLEKQNAFYINYRVLCDEEAKFLQLRIVNVGNPEHVSQIVLGSRMVDEEIRQEMEKKVVLEEALHNANLAIRAKNTFLSNMSHDMRTPLNAVFGYTNLAQKYIDDRDRVSHYLEEINFSGRSLLDLIDKVLEISWTEANDVKITEAECNLADMVQNIRNTLLPQATKKNIQFDLDTSELKHPDVFADQDKLRQAVLYLADNAVEYTPNGGRVSLRVMEAGQWSDYAEYQFIVADNGIGIGEDFLEHIFEPFEREKNTTFSGIYGTGLGLTIAKYSIEIMGGSIDVDSAIDQGSVFTVTLRLRIQEQPKSLDCSAENMVSHLQNYTILLVEDNEINREIETEILTGLGFHIETADNGKIAVDKVKNSKPGKYGLVLMDIQMPVMNGWEATESIRKLENRELAGIPIIALSADAFESDKRKSIESGIDAHLTKPMDVPLLLETMALVWNAQARI